jgi:hypothetical protein
MFEDSEMKYGTDARGRFRLPVWPGPGYLLVNGPTLDYVHKQTSWSEKEYGEPGLAREYYDGIVKLDLKPDDHPQPLRIELERGVTLHCRVVRPDGQPAGGKAYSRSYLQFKHVIHSWLPDVPIDDGLLELPGFEAKHSNPLFLLDFEHHCGTVVSVDSSAAQSSSAPIQLQPCGSARFRFVNDKGKALANYDPMLLLILTPGVVATYHVEPNRPLWSDSIIWQNIVPRGTVATSGADGRVTISDLIPGATYRLSFVNKKGQWDDGYEFTIRPGEMTDVGEVVLPRHD